MDSNQRNIKVRITAFRGEFTGDRWIPRKGLVALKKLTCKEVTMVWVEISLDLFKNVCIFNCILDNAQLVTCIWRFSEYVDIQYLSHDVPSIPVDVQTCIYCMSGWGFVLDLLIEVCIKPALDLGQRLVHINLWDVTTHSGPIFNVGL